MRILIAAAILSLLLFQQLLSFALDTPIHALDSPPELDTTVCELAAHHSRTGDQPVGAQHAAPADASRRLKE
ncbi:MAG TPA: hypothetical protein VN881_00715 [Candidatus Acidoferrales bacterium]|nr:hypothetical protein [Candidatus Acidoferrales bacterium]